ncbi:MAG: DUF4468 domain-containing protein [Sphingobacteriaceae bacterium]|nr:DUF4468 domain-containing protein [Sphingobacteriaceae bacterium]
MKKLILLAFILMPAFTFAQDDVYGKSPEKPALFMPGEFPLKEGKVIYENIESAPGKTKSQIFAASKKWIADRFNSGKAVIQTSEIETGQIVGNAYGDVTLKEGDVFITRINLRFSIQVDCKDDKYRIRFYDIMVHEPGNAYVSSYDTPIERHPALLMNPKKPKQNERKKSHIYSINNYFDAVISDFKNSILKSTNDDF